MSPASDLDRNHKLDWFFDEWVYETGIPSYHLDVDVRAAAANKFVVQGSVAQKDVPSGFEMPVPLVAQYGKDRKALLGRVVATESGARFKFIVPRKPSRVSIDEDNILAVVR